jgi:3-oxoadipate enol-lactonase/4-carboxymuconolactone decarboxylase
VPPAHGRELADAIPGARLVEIPDAGHLLATDAEETVAHAVLSHLESVAAANRRAGENEVSQT